MLTFVVEKFDLSGLETKFYKLLVDGVFQPDRFYKDLSEKALKRMYEKIMFWMQEDSKGNRLPHDSIKPLTRDKNDPYPDYEFKAGRIRVYFFRDPGTGNLIVSAALKDGKKQNKDIEKMRRIKREYFESKGG